MGVKTDSPEIVSLRKAVEKRFFRVLKARRSIKYITLKVPVRPDAMSTEILRREYELGQSLSHPCIVSTLGFEEYSPAGPAILLEYIEGKTLEEYMSGPPVAPGCSGQ